MADRCVNYREREPAFPRPILNRPALGTIDYRIGEYSDFLAAMLREIDAAPALQRWTHREPDDPAIALIQCAAIVGDILSFYQQHYANEAYWRTAKWRSSVAELARLLGYRLAPGLAGVATFAFTVKGSAPITIPEGFPLKAEVGSDGVMTDFETSEELVAHPQLGKFSLYRPRVYVSSVDAGETRLELQRVANSTDLDALRSAELKKGDRILLKPSESMWSNDVAWSEQERSQILTIKSVTETLGRMVVEFDSPIHESWSVPIQAFRLGRTFRHFGHNAPEKFTEAKKSGSEVTGAYERTVDYTRHLNHGCVQHSIKRRASTLELGKAELALSEEANQLALGGWLLIETRVAVNGDPKRMLVARRIESIQSATLSCGAVSGASSIVKLKESIVGNGTIASPDTDLREYRIHETTSARLHFQRVAGGLSGQFSNANNALFFYGTSAEAKPLAGRRLLLEHKDGRKRELTCVSQPSQFVGSTKPRVWLLDFDRAPPFSRSDFNELEPRVTVYGNLAGATQGKTEPEAVLGNGDNRASFQTFKLPKYPLTYLLQPGATPPQQPELEIRVSGRLWKRVDSFFGCGPKDEVYVVREDDENESYVQFGDGETGARLPSGKSNVVAKFRSGSGAYGAPKASSSPSAGQRLEGLDKVFLRKIVTGGAAPEPAESARVAAPGRVQSLGRVVSLQDYETEVLALPGVVRAVARWDLHEGVPSLMLRVLLEAGRVGEFAAIRAQIEQVRRCRGSSGHPVVVEQAFLRFLYLDVEYAFDPVLLESDVARAIRSALGLAGDAEATRTGLFGLERRTLGEREYASRVAGTVQQVSGVLWCRVTAFKGFPMGIDAETTALPPVRVRHGVVACAANQLLQLHPHHLTLTSVAAPEEEC